MLLLSKELLYHMVFRHLSKKESVKNYNKTSCSDISCQKRGRCKGTIPLSSVKAVEFVDDTAFDNNKYCYCFQVGTFI